METCIRACSSTKQTEQGQSDKRAYLWVLQKRLGQSHRVFLIQISCGVKRQYMFNRRIVWGLARQEEPKWSGTTSLETNIPPHSLRADTPILWIGLLSKVARHLYISLFTQFSGTKENQHHELLKTISWHSFLRICLACTEVTLPRLSGQSHHWQWADVEESWFLMIALAL